MSCKCCLPEVCTHPAHIIHMLLRRDCACEEDTPSRGRAVENKEMKTERKTGKVSHKLSLDQSHPNVEDRSVCKSEDNQLSPTSMMCLSPEFGLTVSPQFHRPHWPPQQSRNTFRSILNQTKELKVSCIGKERDARMWEEG